MGLNLGPSRVDVLNFSMQNVTVLGDTAFQEVIEMPHVMGPLGWWDIVHSDCPYKKRKFGCQKETLDIPTQKEGHVRSQGEAGHLQVKV